MSDTQDTRRETWRNVTQGKVMVVKIDNRGNLTDERVMPGKVVNLTLEERKLNHDRAASDELDVFKNGRMAPVTLIEDADDYAEIAANPNLMSDADMARLFKGRLEAFQKRLAEIQNTAALHRIHDLALDPATNATVAQLKAVEARLEELREEQRPVLGGQLAQEWDSVR